MSKTVVITGARAPAALHLARLFHHAGHRVVLADTFDRPMAKATRFKHGYVRLPSPRAGFSNYVDAVQALIEQTAPDLVIPTCEEVFYLAAARDRRDLNLPLFAPHFDKLAMVHNKADFCELAAGFGADPPTTHRLTSATDVRALSERGPELVLKPAWSRFGSRVLIRPTKADLLQLKPTPSDPWVAQSYLPGEEICAYAVARAGTLVAFRAYKPTYRVGTGAGVAFEPANAPAARTFTAGLVTALGWTGQISFDFRHDAQGGLHVIECNPRATSGVHYFNGEDALPDAMLGGGNAAPSGAGPMALPLAMLAYGLPFALRNHGVRQWLADFRKMQDIATWPGDTSMLAAQLSALAEIAGRAVKNRTGLIEASVRDIEWDGEPLT